jgi:hypothetical protein
MTTRTYRRNEADDEVQCGRRPYRGQAHLRQAETDLNRLPLDARAAPGSFA